MFEKAETSVDTNDCKKGKALGEDGACGAGHDDKGDEKEGAEDEKKDRN